MEIKKILINNLPIVNEEHIKIVILLYLYNYKINIERLLILKTKNIIFEQFYNDSKFMENYISITSYNKYFLGKKINFNDLLNDFNKYFNFSLDEITIIFNKIPTNFILDNNVYITKEELLKKFNKMETGELRYNQLLRIMKIFNHKRINLSLFLEEKTYYKILDFFDREKFKPGTKISYLKSITTLLNYFTDRIPELNAEIYGKYMFLLNNLENYIEKHKSEKEVINHLIILEKLKNLLNDDKIKNIYKIIYFIYSYGYDTNDYIGILRPNDIFNTKIKNYDTNYNFIDFEKKIWIFNENSTKNSKYREIKISGNFIDNLKKYLINDEWLIRINDKLKINTITTTIKTHVNVTASQIRASFVTFINKEKSLSEALKYANNIGHSHKTAIKDYVRKNI